MFANLDRIYGEIDLSSLRGLTEGAVVKDPGYYSISEIKIKDGSAAVTVSTDKSCRLILQFLSDDGKTRLSTSAARVGGGLSLETVNVPLNGRLPDNFRILAVLRDNNDNALSNTLTEYAYTSAYRGFSALTPEDGRFKDKDVIDFTATQKTTLSRPKTSACLPTVWILWKPPAYQLLTTAVPTLPKPR